MADTRRLAAHDTTRGQSKLVLVGDQAQLPSIGAGGMFASLQEQVPSARSRRSTGPSSMGARGLAARPRGTVRQGAREYRRAGQLHISDTREQAAEQMVDAWARDRRRAPGRSAR